MKRSTLTIPAKVKYLKEVITELPRNAIFDKGKTGCGGTTLALAGDKKYIIAVPYIKLAENKANQSNGEIFSFTGSTSEKDLKKYLDTHPVPKIMVTYDSLDKLINITGTTGYNLLVDEYHLLFTQYSFRDKAVDKVLKNFDKFDSFTFMTATQLEDDFILDELKDIDIVTTVWEEQTEVEIQSIHCLYDVESTVEEIINQFLHGQAQGNAYIFVNSVEFIKAMVQKCNLTNSNTRAIWSKHNNADPGLINSKPSDLPKKINLITSTCFEGVDFYDNEGRTFIVSDDKKPHSLLDVSTSVKQIAGRIRNSQYNTINHLYSKTDFVNVLPFDEYKKLISIETYKASEIVKELNNLSADAKKVVEVKYKYVLFDGTTFKLNINQVKLDLFNHRITRVLYNNKSILSNEIKNYGFKVIERVSNYNSAEETYVQENDNTHKDKLKETIKRLKSINYQKGKLSTYAVSAFEKYPFLENAIHSLGYKEIEDLGYSKTKILRKITAKSSNNSRQAIIKLLNGYPQIKPNTFVSSAILKKVFSEIYNLLGQDKSPKGADIESYYNVKETSRKINGKSVKGFELLNELFI